MSFWRDAIELKLFSEMNAKTIDSEIVSYLPLLGDGEKDLYWVLLRPF